MALRSSLFASLSTRGIAASAAAVLMVGGGVAVAQSGTLSTDAEESVIEGLDDAPSDDAEPMEAPPVDAPPVDAPPEGGPTPTQVPPPEDDDLTIVEELQGEPADEDDESENAEVFSTWVESLPDDWGCLKGQLVSHFARGGPTAFSEGDGEFETAGDVARFLEAEGRGVPGRCAERLLADGEDVILDDDAEVEGSSAEPNRPEGAGPPARGEDGKPAHAGEPGPPPHAEAKGRPDHAGPKGDGDGPGKSGNARGGPGNGDS